MNPPEPRESRKIVIGVVTSISGKKSIKVVVDYKKPHPLYRKEVSRQTVLHCHDEECVAKLGDKVEVMQSRPLSRMKRWRLVRVVEAAPVIA